MYDDSGVRLSKLQVDGGMASNKLFLQMLANIVGINVTTPNLLETTALGVALAAGKAKGIDLFKLDDENEMKSEMSSYVPRIHGERKNSILIVFIYLILIDFLEREDNCAAWKRAVIKSFERPTVPFNIENKGRNCWIINSCY
jgi:glycerol kinase